MNEQHLLNLPFNEKQKPSENFQTFDRTQTILFKLIIDLPAIVHWNFSFCSKISFLFKKILFSFGTYLFISHVFWSSYDKYKYSIDTLLFSITGLNYI